MLALLTPVAVPLIESGRAVSHEGVIVGRTREASPRYDVRLTDGRIVRDVTDVQTREAA